MKYIVILIIVFLMMLMGPFVVAIVYCRKKQGEVLSIKQDRVRDPRYFGKSFSALVEKNLKSVNEGIIKLSKEEPFIDADKKNHWEKEIKDIVICRAKDLRVPKETEVFEKEIYSAHNIEFVGEHKKLRAAYAKEKMVLGKSTIVERWVDAEQTITVSDDCDLGISATAGNRLCLGMGCDFRRLFAREILIGQYPDTNIDSMANRNRDMWKVEKTPEVVRNIDSVNEEMTNDRKEAAITVLTNRNLTVLENIIIKGDICSHKGVRLCDHVVVCGNIFAENDIYIGSDVVVLGNVFTQGSIYVEKKAMIGQPGEIVSIIARENISFEEEVFVYGYVACEKGGKIIRK